jgi:asparagine synthase (glutamine-hydrolysing)
MMMAGSIEGRMPFMDTALAGIVARFPDEYLVGGRGGKRVLRAAMSKLLPKHILDRKKVGFRVPIGEWFKGPYREYVKDMLISRTSSVASICDRGALKQVVDEHLVGRQNHEKLLWSLINLEMFIRTFKPDGLPRGSIRPECILMNG